MAHGIAHGLMVAQGGIGPQYRTGLLAVTADHGPALRSESQQWVSGSEISTKTKSAASRFFNAIKEWFANLGEDITDKDKAEGGVLYDFRLWVESKFSKAQPPKDPDQIEYGNGYILRSGSSGSDSDDDVGDLANARRPTPSDAPQPNSVFHGNFKFVKDPVDFI